MRDNPETTRFYRRRLPHWEVADGRYFVTIRLKGAIPRLGVERVRGLRAQYEAAVANGQDGLREQRAVFREMERWLDRADTVDYLTRPAVAKMVKEAIAYRERNRTWRMFAYTLMPNHIHLFFGLGRQSSREAAVVGPSSSSESTDPADSARIDRRYNLDAQTGCADSDELDAPTGSDSGLDAVLHGFKRRTGRQANRILGRSGEFWQREWFDHWSRSAAEDERTVRYIAANPVKAGLVACAEQWPLTRLRRTPSPTPMNEKEAAEVGPSSSSESTDPADLARIDRSYNLDTQSGCADSDELDAPTPSVPTHPK